MFRRLVLGAAVAAAAVGLALAPSVAEAATPAIAASAPAHCNSGAMCGFTGAYFTGSYGNLQGTNANLVYFPWTSVDSVYNNGNQCDVTIFSGTGFSGYQTLIQRGYQYGNLQTDNPVYYHHIYSNRFC